MHRRAICRLFGLLFLAFILQQGALGNDSRSEVTIWLIPLEYASNDPSINLESFNTEVEQGGWVRILNTSVPHYRDQLVAWNPEYDYPNFPVIKGQVETVRALRRFAKQHQVRINVRFVWWGQTFKELQALDSAGRDAQRDENAPDVAQVGSTWVGFFAKANILLPLSAAPNDVYQRDQALSWRDTPRVDKAALRYTTDVRLIYYWRRMSYPPLDQPFSLVRDSWDKIIESISSYSIDPNDPRKLAGFSPKMVMPIGMTTNLLHDYVPLIWAGGGHFMDKNLVGADLTSDKALAIPRKLMGNYSQGDSQKGSARVVTFPEMSHEQAIRYFFNGEYLALIEPVNFIERWREEIALRGLPPSFFRDPKKRPKPETINFWDYAGVAVPPRTFIGGSDLIVTSRVKNKDIEKRLAFELLRFLTNDDTYAPVLARVGALPAQLPELGVDALCTLLRSKTARAGSQREADGTKDLANALRTALAERDAQEYPALAEWPLYIESPEVLEAIQRIWRRVKEGGQDKTLKDAAAEAELVINKNFYPSLKLREEIKHWWWVILFGGLSLSLTLVAVLLRVQFGKNRAQAETINETNGKILALRLYQAKMHDLTKINGTNVIQFAEEIKSLMPTPGDASLSLLSGCRRKLDELISYGEHLVKDFTQRSAQRTFAICEEMERPQVCVPLREVVERAYEGALIEFKAVYAKDAPAALLSLDESLHEWRLMRLPTSMGVVLQEWFYNCLKMIDHLRPPDRQIEVRVQQPEQAAKPPRLSPVAIWRALFGARQAGNTTTLCILSPIAIPAEKANILNEPPAPYWKSSSQGLRLIRDILSYGFATKAACQTLPSGQTLLSIPITLMRSHI